MTLIPVRGGSRGIPGKNLRAPGGVPLVARTIRTALAATGVGRVVVSTDSRELARVAREEGAEVPFLRPASLARDETPMLEVLLHAWNHLGTPPALVLLQATSPFLTAATLDRAIGIFRRSGALQLKAVRKVREHPGWMLRPEGGLLVPYLEGTATRRQDLPDLYYPCGAVYIYSGQYLERPDLSAPAAWIELTWPESLDVDEAEDLVIAESLLASGKVGDSARNAVSGAGRSGPALSPERDA